MDMESGIDIRPIQMEHLEALLELRMRNRAFAASFEPIQPDAHFTLEGQREVIQQVLHNREGGTGYGFGIFLTETNALIGRINLSNVSRGAWQSCTLGYFLDQAHNGRGYTTQAVRLVCRYAFEDAGLHRLQAAVMPRNEASIRVLEKAGFHYDGHAEYYLNINGSWEHHNLYSLTKEYWSAAPTF
jgi:ribosomal-protein-alanine N-acetyltransferase